MANQFQIFNMTLPPEGPCDIPFNADFSVNTEIDIDFTQLIEQRVVSYISGFYFDNSQNAEDVEFICSGTNQKLILPASKQGWLPIAAANPPVFKLAVSAPGNILKLHFFNFPVWPYIIGDAGGGGGGGNVSIVGSIPLNIAGPAISDFSLTLSGGSETLVPAGDASQFFSVFNEAGNSDITINLAGGDASISGIVIPSGGSFTLDNGCSNEITISGTNGDNVSCFAGA